MHTHNTHAHTTYFTVQPTEGVALLELGQVKLRSGKCQHMGGGGGGGGKAAHGWTGEWKLGYDPSMCYRSSQAGS